MAQTFPGDIKEPRHFSSRHRLEEGARACWRYFEDCSTLSEPVRPYRQPLQTQYSKFKVWCGNLGMLEEDHLSLDWRLRNAQEIESQIYSLLHDLAEDLAGGERAAN